MKKKSARGIPDFSRQPSRSKPGTPSVAPAPKSKIVNAAPRPKPQATSSKSGQRGK